MPSRHARDWTDLNVHDPGITIVEALAYGLTDLAFGLRERLVAARCGRRCTVMMIAGVAGALAVIAYRGRATRSRGTRLPQPGLRVR